MVAIPTGAHAELQFVTGTCTPLTASAKLDFAITIPKFVYVRIGTGTNVANNTSVDNLVYTVPAANVGDSSAITGTGGDLTGGKVRVRVIGNNGTIAFSSTTLGAMSNGAGDTISWSQMDVAVATNTPATALNHPTLVDGSMTSINLTPTPAVCHCPPSPSLPTHEVWAENSRSSLKSKPPPTSGTDNRLRDPISSAPHGREPPVKTCSLSCSYETLSLKSWGLRQSRGGSM